MQHNLRTISDEVEFISRSKRGTSHFSSDLERAPGARSIAVEFVEVPPLVIELLRCENTAFHVHAAPFGIRTLSFFTFVSIALTHADATRLQRTQVDRTCNGDGCGALEAV